MVREPATSVPSDHSRYLVVIDKDPFPTDSGSKLRLVALLSAVADAVTGDLVLLGIDDPSPELRAMFSGWTTHACAVVKHTRRLGPRMRWLLGSAGPTAIAVLDTTAADRLLARLAATEPNTVVALRYLPAMLCARLAPEHRLVVDFEDVESAKISRALRRATGPRGSTWWAQIRDRLDVTRWNRLEVAIVGRADCVTVCSAVDRARLGDGAHVVVVPNGVPVPIDDVAPVRSAAALLTDGRLGRQFVVAFIGQLTYRPNVDAARLLVSEIVPRLRERGLDPVVLLVGRHGEDVASLARNSDDVHATGFVDDLRAIYARADVVAVPLRDGTGTRIKILEAAAHCVPVVATTVAAEGLTDLGVATADDWDEFAALVERVHLDPTWSSALAEHAKHVVADRYTWPPIQRAFVRLVVARRSDRTEPV